jgi:uncharacterized protein (TIGR03067 family)
MKALITSTLSALLTTISLVAAEPAANERPAEEPAVTGQEKSFEAALPGKYQILTSEKNGHPSDKAEFEGMVVEITKDKIVTSNRDRQEVHAATYKIDETQMPAHITMVSVLERDRGLKAKGLIAIEQHQGKDRVKLIYTLPDGKIMPTEFKTLDGQVMVVLQKIEAVRTAAEDALLERR